MRHIYIYIYAGSSLHKFKPWALWSLTPCESTRLCCIDTNNSTNCPYILKHAVYMLSGSIQCLFDSDNIVCLGDN